MPDCGLEDANLLDATTTTKLRWFGFTFLRGLERPVGRSDSRRSTASVTSFSLVGAYACYASVASPTKLQQADRKFYRIRNYVQSTQSKSGKRDLTLENRDPANLHAIGLYIGRHRHVFFAQTKKRTYWQRWTAVVGITPNHPT